MTIERADGSTERAEVPSDDWFEDIPPNAFGPLTDGVSPVHNGMDRLFAGSFHDANEAALFEAIIAVRPAAEVTALTLDPERGSFDQEITRFNLFAITGMAAR